MGFRWPDQIYLLKKSRKPLSFRDFAVRWAVRETRQATDPRCESNPFSSAHRTIFLHFPLSPVESTLDLARIGAPRAATPPSGVCQGT